MCRVVFDDGETQTFYVRDVFSSPRLTSRQKVGARVFRSKPEVVRFLNVGQA